MTIQLSKSQCSVSSILSTLQNIIGDSKKLTEALGQCQTGLASKSYIGAALETVLTLYPQCIRAKGEISKHQYDDEARRSPEIHETLFTARTMLSDVVAQYARVSTIQCGPDLANTKSQLGVPTELVFALQLKACMKYLKDKKRDKHRISARRVAEALYVDIASAAEFLKQSVVCHDVVIQSRSLVEAIGSDVYWPQPYLGREADADLLLRLAHTVICSPVRAQAVTASIHTRLTRLRRLISTFIDTDANQITPLTPRRVRFVLPDSPGYPGRSPANTINTLGSSSTLTMTPSGVAARLFGAQHLDPDVELYDDGEVGQGGFGSVHKAKWMGRDVALKVIRGSAAEDGSIDPSTLRKVKRESSIWKDVYHQYVLPFYGVAEWKGQDALVSPWVSSNHSLEHFSHLSEKNRRKQREMIAGDLTEACVAQRLKFATEVACGILYLHERNITHGDIRMGNVLVSPASEPLITDFGLSKPIMKSFDTQPSTAFERAGTARWMAPELHLDQDPKRTKASDVWAFACTVLELFSGTHPYAKDRNAAFYLRICERTAPEVPAHLKKAAPALWRILKGCWAPMPEDRPQMEVIFTSMMMIRTGRDWMLNAVGS